MIVRPVEWRGGIPGKLRILDQRLLPHEEKYLERSSVGDLFGDIRSLAVRGAPAIGIAAAFGVVLGAQERIPGSQGEIADSALKAADFLAGARPTAVNLFSALDRMRRRIREASSASARDLPSELLAEARAIFEEDDAICRAIGRNGSRLIEDGMGVLTHRNAGGLLHPATARRWAWFSGRWRRERNSRCTRTRRGPFSRARGSPHGSWSVRGRDQSCFATPPPVGQ